MALWRTSCSLQFVSHSNQSHAPRLREDRKLGVDSGLMGSAPQMLGVRGKRKKRPGGQQTTGAVLPDMIAPQANLSVGDKR